MLFGALPSFTSENNKITSLIPSQATLCRPIPLDLPSACYYNSTMERIQGPHDRIFKRAMADRENAISPLVVILSEAVRKHLVLEEIFYEKEGFVSEHA